MKLSFAGDIFVPVHDQDPAILTEQLSIGIIGAGSFALFAAQSFLKVDGIHIKAVMDIDEAAASLFARAIGSTYYTDYSALLADDGIDLIYIGSPPFLHASQSMEALRAGKHVICEKPAALLTADAEDIAAYAKAHNLLYTVNLMQRYNPLYEIVGKIIEEKWLGDFVHGFFENYASDEKLIPAHWFWNKEMSGGIFIEHGVHFFDMFSGWFGAGQLIHSLEIARDNIVDRVQAVVLYENNPVTFYHGFNQPKLLDRQELRLQFDRGDITLYEWIPVKIRLHGLLTHPQLDALMEILPGCDIEIREGSEHSKGVRGKFRNIQFDVLATITSGDIGDKMDRYEQLVIAMITDQWTWIKDRTHKRKITEVNAVESLRIAEEATLKATLY